MKYFSIDTETTGLDTKRAQILQVAIVYDDGVSPIDQLPFYSAIVDNRKIEYGEATALKMNQWLFDRIAKGEGFDWRHVLRSMHHFILEHSPNVPITNLPVAGANAAQFDLPILSRHGLNRAFLHHRVIDVASLYLPTFGEMAGLHKINELTGRGAVKHDALSDAFDVVYAVRKALQK